MSAPVNKTDAKSIQLVDAQSSAVNSNDIDWQDGGAPGFEIKRLFADEATGLNTCLLRVAAGALWPMHSHDDIEQIYVVNGTFFDHEKTYVTGEFIVRDSGVMHVTGSKDGAILLLAYSSTKKN